jgi:hypothetical protein
MVPKAQTFLASVLLTFSRADYDCCTLDKMKPDTIENRIRFGCGFTFGLASGFFFAVQWVADTWGGFAATSITTAIVCGLLAMKYGDAFWYSLKDWFWW